MINLQRLIQLHFPSDDALLADERVRQLLDRELLLAPEELAVQIYRVQSELLHLFGEKTAHRVLTMLWYLQRMYTQIEIYYTAEIGANFRIIHGLGTVIGARVKIGDNVVVYQGVTVGTRHSSVHKRPVIGDHTVLYSGSKVLGPITLGEHCVVGADSLVLDSFPAHSVVFGRPARLKRMNAPANADGQHTQVKG